MRRYLLTMRIPPLRVYRWVSIAARYPPLQRRQTSPNSRQSQGKNLPGRILPLHPMVTSDQPLHLRPSFHLLFLHFISRPINCISPSSDSLLCFFSGSGLRGEACSRHLGGNLVYCDTGFGLQRRASHDLPKVP